jgi:hypothetical protein
MDIYNRCRHALFEGGYEVDGWHPATRMALLAEHEDCPVSLKYLIWKDLMPYVAIPKALEMKQAEVIGAVGANIRVISYSGDIPLNDGAEHFGLPEQLPVVPYVPPAEKHEQLESWERRHRHEALVNEQIRREVYARPLEAPPRWPESAEPAVEVESSPLSDVDEMALARKRLGTDIWGSKRWKH